MAKVIMVQGTMSGAGKSLICAGLLRMLRLAGYSCAPFKAQNMALNSYVTRDGGEIGRAQALQAFAAGIEPTVDMNPVLLKPSSDTGSQVIVLGQPQTHMGAKEYYAKKAKLIPVVKAAFERLSENYDYIVIEGAGSPAEINLREDDFVNMGMAAIADCQVILVGDIDRGGVFAQLYGTYLLLQPEERARIKGFLVNKFRGDISILEPGLRELEQLTGRPVLGVMPYMNIELEEEDSISEHISKGSSRITDPERLIRIGVIRLPRISNYTDFQPFALEDDVVLTYITKPSQLNDCHAVIIPGTKSTISDLRWLKETGFSEKLRSYAAKGNVIMGICGGLQIMGETIKDIHGIETQKGSAESGLGLLQINTVFNEVKIQKQHEGIVSGLEGEFSALNGSCVRGYEIHHGNSDEGERLLWTNGSCIATYIHGIFDEPQLRERLLGLLAKRNGFVRHADAGMTYDEYRNRQLDILAGALKEALGTDWIKLFDEEKSEKKPIQYVKPSDIEKRSMEIIEQELGSRAKDFTQSQLPIVKRAIHTTADFEYADNLFFSKDAVERLQDMLRKGCCIITDTRMAYSGINKNRLAEYGCRVDCFMDNEEVAALAKERGTTRAAVSVERAAELDEDVLYVVGNAPTALIRINELKAQGAADNIKGIVAVPVGFVNVVEAKELILELKEPHIVARGRKGGSNLAAAVINALVYTLEPDGQSAN